MEFVLIPQTLEPLTCAPRITCQPELLRHVLSKATQIEASIPPCSMETAVVITPIYNIELLVLKVGYIYAICTSYRVGNQIFHTIHVTYNGFAQLSQWHFLEPKPLGCKLGHHQFNQSKNSFMAKGKATDLLLAQIAPKNNCQV